MSYDVYEIKCSVCVCVSLLYLVYSTYWWLVVSVES